MSRTVDERIVQMTFDNKNFEKNANQTLSTLDKLKKAFNFGESSSSFRGLQRAADALDFSSFTGGLENVSVKFNKMALIGISALNRLTEKAVDAGVKLVKSLSIDQITKSWSKYDALISSEQSIMSAISDKINPLTKQKYQIEDVVEIIEKLQWYTDETSYSISQMTSAIAQFTSSGIDINTATEAILGISNACADAGVSTQKAESAFIGFSRAIGQGYLTIGTWNMQLRTSGITNSERFKQSLIDAAVAAGRLEKKISKTGEVYYKTTKKTAKAGQIVSASDFTSHLSDTQWANKNVILAALKGYSNTVDSLYGLMNEGVLDPASKVMQDLAPKMEKAGKTLADLGLDKEFDTASQAIEALEAAYKSLGITVPKSLKAFKMAQEAISFTQAIEATSDAVSTKWSKTYELIFGNYDEARKLWTKLANEMWYWFAETGDDRNEQLAKWHDSIIKVADGFEFLNKQESVAKDAVDNFDGMVNVSYKELTGYEALMQSFFKILEYITTIVETVRDAIGDIFPPLSSSGMLQFTKAFYEFVDKIKPSEGFLEALSNAIRTVASVFKYFKDIFTLFYNKAIKPSIGPIRDLIKYFNELLTPIEEFIIKSAKAVSTNNFLWKSFELVGSIFSKIIGIIRKLTERFASFFGDIKEKHGETISKFGATIKESIIKVLEFIDNALDNDSFKWFDTILDVGSKIVDFFVSLPGKIKSALGNIQGVINKVWTKLGGALSKIGEGITGFLTGNTGNWRNIAQTGAIALIIPMLTRLNKLTKQLNIDQLTKWIQLLVNGGDDDDSGKQSFLEKLFPTITGKTTSVLDKVGTAVENISKKASGSTDTFGKIAKGMLILAAALFVIGKIDSDKVYDSLVTISLLIAEMFFLMKGLSKLTGEGTTINKWFQKVTKNDPTKGLIKIAASILILAIALRVVSKIPFDNMMSGLLGIGILLAEMFGFIYLLSDLKIEKVTKGLSALIAVSASMLIVSAAVKVLSKIDEAAMYTAIVGVGLLLLEFAALFNLIKNVKASTILSLGLSMVAISASLVLMTGVIKLLSMIDPTAAGNALGAIALLLTELAAFINAASLAGAGKVLAVAAAMLIMAPAFVIFAASIKMLSKLPFAKIVSSVAGIGILLVVLAGFAALVSATGTTLSFIALSAAMLLMSVSLTALAGALWILGQLDWNQLKKGIVAFTAMIVIIGALGVIFGSVVVPILAFAAALALLGVAFVLFGEGLKVLSVALLEANLFSDFLTGLRTQLPTFTSEGAQLFIDGINSVADVFRTKSGDFGAAIGNLAEAIIEGLIKAIGGFITGFGGSLISFVSDGVSAVVNWFKGDKNTEAIKSSGEKVVGEVQSGMESKKQDLLDTSEDLTDDMTDALDGTAAAKIAGTDTLNGLLSGLTDSSMLTKISNAGRNAANVFNNSYTNSLGINSPSRVMKQNAAFTIQGLIDGFREHMTEVSGAGTKTGTLLADSLAEAISITESMDSDLLHPTITPVIDTSMIDSGLSSINSMLGTQRALNLSGRVSKANAESQNGGNVTNTTTYSPTINLTVNAAASQSASQVADIVINKIRKNALREASVWE